MKFIKRSSLMAAVALTAMTSSLAMADDAGWYMGGNLGQSNAEIDEARISRSMMDEGFTLNSFNADNSDKGYKLYGGYQFNQHLALEGGYFDLGEFNFNATTIPEGTLAGSINLRGINLDLVGFLPVTEKLSAFARAGVNYAEAKDAFSGSGSVNIVDPNPRKKAANLKAGLGLQYAFNDSVAMRLEAERYRIDDAVGNKGDVDLISAGVVYRFGKKSQAIAAVEPMRQPAAVLQPAPRSEKYTLSSTELFDFNSSTLRTPQPKLNEISDAINRDKAPTKMTIVGYSDRIGSEEYNQKLAERRANSVKNYLISKGVTADRLQVVSKGEADPIVVCDEKDKAALIDCLKPNRRAEIDKITIVRDLNK